MKSALIFLAIILFLAPTAFADMADLEDTVQSCQDAEAAYYVAHSAYYQGNCEDMPGFVSSGGTFCFSSIIEGGDSFTCDVKQVGVGRCHWHDSTLSLTCAE